MKDKTQTLNKKYRDPLVYIERLGTSGTQEVWQVHGGYIRANIDIEFSNFSQPLDPKQIKYIPNDEFWMDKEASPDEYKAFLIHLNKEWSLQKKGIPWEKAHDEAIKAEKAYRDKHRGGRSKGPYIKKLGKFDDAVIWEVDGKFVRDWYDIDFTEGGHGIVYHPWIPENEIWIDNDLSDGERKYVIFHEGYERRLMKKGMKYEEAHKKSSAKELQMRKKDWKAKEEEVLGQLEIVEIVKDLFQSTVYTKGEIPILKEMGIDLVVDLIGQDITHIPGIDLLKFPFEDEEKLPDDMTELLQSVDVVFARWMKGEKVLVHCYGGNNRSGLFIGLMLKRAGMSGEDAVKKIKRERPGALNNSTFRKYLEEDHEA